MVFAITTLVSVLAAIYLIKVLPAKLSGIIMLAAAAGLTIFICVAKPVMHKPFSVNVIEYLIKVNDDGSITTTKQTTTTVLEGKNQK